MGFIHEQHGRITAETRSESVVVHIDEPNRNEPHTDFWWHQEGRTAPELLYTDILDLMEALNAPKVRERWDSEEIRTARGWRSPESVRANEAAAGTFSRRVAVTATEGESFGRCLEAVLHEAIESARRRQREHRVGTEAYRDHAMVIATLAQAIADRRRW